MVATTTSAVRAGAVAFALALSTTLTSCAGGRSAMSPAENFTAGQSDRFVIAKGDLPPGYTKGDANPGKVACDSGWLANQGALAETAGEAAVKHELLALGPRACRVSFYEKATGGGVTGFGLRTVVFPTPDAASASLALFERSLSDPLLTESWAADGETPSPAQRVPSPGLGDESRPSIKRVTTGLGGPGLSGTTIEEIWRVRNVALVLSVGHVAELAESDVLQIARNVSARAVK